MISALTGIIDRLRRADIDPDAVNELDRLLSILQDNGWSGTIPADEALVVVTAERDALRQLVIEAYYGDHPTNGWRRRAESLNAWPGAS